MNLQVKKIIALSLVSSLILLETYCLVANKTFPEGYLAIISSVIAYYFGRSHKEED